MPKITYLVFTIIILFATQLGFAQTTDFIKDDGITNALHKANVGKITFMAKAIAVYQNGGTWKGKQIIPKSWVKESLTKSSENTANKLVIITSIIAN